MQQPALAPKNQNAKKQSFFILTVKLYTETADSPAKRGWHDASCA